MRSSDRKVEKGETENSSTLQLELYKYIPADPHERVDADEVAGDPKIRLRVPGDKGPDERGGAFRVVEKVDTDA